MNALHQRSGRARVVFLLVSLAVLVPIGIGTISRALAQSGAEGDDSLYKHLSVFTEVLSLIQRSYVDEISVAQLFAGALEGTTNALDPLSTLVPAPDVQRYREARRVGNAHSGLSVGREDGISFVIGVDPGSPGDSSGVEAGDILAEVNGRSTREMPLWELQILLANPQGTLDLELLRRGERVDAEVDLGIYEQAPPSLRFERDAPVLRINSFAAKTAESVELLLQEEDLARSSVLIVDVRGSAGGDVEAAYEVAALFASGELGDLRARGEAVSVRTSDEPPLWTGRMALLADGGCQGASEVFLSALKDLPTADVVGRRTFGHAGRAASRPLPTGATLFFTDGFYAGPDGRTLDQPIEPEFPVQVRLLTLGKVEDEVRDEILERAREVLFAEDEAVEDAA